jgi:hypothetical protein
MWGGLIFGLMLLFISYINYANDDFSCGWGHKADMNDLIFQDENGEEY